MRWPPSPVPPPAAVAAAVAEAARSFGGAAAPAGAEAPARGVERRARGGRSACREAAQAAPSAGELTATFTLHNKVGLHARPAALLARLVAGFDAEVTVNDVDAASVLALMGLGLEKGDEMHVRARGAQAEDAMAAVDQAVADGFGEE